MFEDLIVAASSILLATAVPDSALDPADLINSTALLQTSDDQSKPKKAPRKRKEPEPTEYADVPIAPSKPYFLFLAKTKDQTTKENPDEKPKIIKDIQSKQWKEMGTDDKKVYEDEYKELSESYETDMAAYKELHPSYVKPEPMPKKAKVSPSSSDDPAANVSVANKKEPKTPKEPKPPKEPNATKAKTPKKPKPPKEPKATKSKTPKEPNPPKESKATKTKTLKEPKTPKTPKKPKAAKTPKEPKTPKKPKEKKVSTGSSNIVAVAESSSSLSNVVKAVTFVVPEIVPDSFSAELTAMDLREEGQTSAEMDYDSIGRIVSLKKSQSMVITEDSGALFDIENDGNQVMFSL